MRLILCAAVVTALAGCSTLITPENAARSTTASSVGSERTYRNILSAMRECYPTAMTMESNYFPEAKEGEITLVHIYDTSRIEFAKLKVVPAGDRAAVLMDTNKKFAEIETAMPQWVKGDAGPCPFGTRVQAPYPSQNPYAQSPR